MTDPEKSGVVMADQLAAELEALYVRVRMEMVRGFLHNLKTTCEDMRATAKLLRSMALSQPTQTARVLLSDDLLYSRAGNGLLEVWRCLPVWKEKFVVMKQEKECTEEIPVKFEFYNKTQIGYMDPRTLVIAHRGHPADCGLTTTTPLILFGSINLYKRQQGVLTKMNNADQLRVLSYHWKEEHKKLFAPQIYRPVTMYSWQEMEPSIDLNALLKTTAAQAEVMAILGAQIQEGGDSNTTQMAEQMAVNIVAKGMASLVTMISNPFYLWVFCICSGVTGVAIWKLVKMVRRHRKRTFRIWKTNQTPKKKRAWYNRRNDDHGEKERSRSRKC